MQDLFAKHTQSRHVSNGNYSTAEKKGNGDEKGGGIVLRAFNGSCDLEKSIADILSGRNLFALKQTAFAAAFRHFSEPNRLSFFCRFLLATF